MTFLELQTEVKTLLIDTPSAIVTLTPRFVNRACRALQTRHNFRVMRASMQNATTFEVRRLVTAVPDNWKASRGTPYLTDYLGPVHDLYYVVDTGSALLTYTADQTGRPYLIGIDDPEDEVGTAHFNVFPLPDGLSDYSDGEYVITIPYWKYLAELVNDTDTNWFTMTSETAEYIVARATEYGFRANEDEGRADVWASVALNLLAEAISVDKHAALAQMHSFTYHKGARFPRHEG
jgi:hypothetical protein